MKQHILVIGASGSNGSEIVRLLKEQGQTVRIATSKKPSSPEQVQLNLLAGEGLSEAFKNIDRAFLLSPGGYADQYKILSPLIAEAKKQNLKKVVLMTAMGADADPNSPLRRAEVELEKSGLTYNIIRPNWFMENFNTYWFHGIKTQNKILVPAENAKISFIDTRDIAAVAAKLLTDDTLKNQAFNLTGSEAIDHAQAARAISEVARRNITYENISPDDFKKALLGAGETADYTELLLLLFSYVRAGYGEPVTTEVKKILGREPIKFQAYAQSKSW